MLDAHSGFFGSFCARCLAVAPAPSAATRFRERSRLSDFAEHVCCWVLGGLRV